MSNVLQIPNKNSALSASYSAAGKATSTSVTVPKILTIDTLTVKSIILLDSLFTKNDIDVSEIAKTFGGGGHKNAAGFITDINPVTLFS